MFQFKVAGVGLGIFCIGTGYTYWRVISGWNRLLKFQPMDSEVSKWKGVIAERGIVPGLGVPEKEASEFLGPMLPKLTVLAQLGWATLCILGTDFRTSKNRSAKEKLPKSEIDFIWMLMTGSWMDFIKAPRQISLDQVKRTFVTNVSHWASGKAKEQRNH